MKVNTGNCIVNLDWFFDYTVYFEKEYCYLMGTDKNGIMRKYKIHGIETLAETKFAYNEIKMGLEDGLTYIDISLFDSYATNTDDTK